MHGAATLVVEPEGSDPENRQLAQLAEQRNPISTVAPPFTSGGNVHADGGGAGAPAEPLLPPFPAELAPAAPPVALPPAAPPDPPVASWPPVPPASFGSAVTVPQPTSTTTRTPNSFIPA